MIDNFKAYIVREGKNGVFSGQIETKKFDDLPPNEITIKVKYSSLNYKDALSSIGNKGVTKKYPHTPGIDAAGIVVSSKSEKFSINDKVIVTGFDLGMNTSGGFSEYVRVPAEWVVRLPEAISLKYAMAFGTAGLTAVLCIDLLNKNCGIKNNQAIVTGSTGGVGSVTIQLLSKLGAQITAVTGKRDSNEFLREIGANTILTRDELVEKFRHPLSKGIYDIGVDVVGGKVLSGLLTCLKRNGAIACCGNVGGPDFSTSVFPFILRGNRLLGVDSAERSLDQKESLWEKISDEWMLNDIEKYCKIIGLNDLGFELRKIYDGKQTGRVIVSIDK